MCVLSRLISVFHMCSSGQVFRLCCSKFLYSCGLLVCLFYPALRDMLKSLSTPEDLPVFPYSSVNFALHTLEQYWVYVSLNFFVSSLLIEILSLKCISSYLVKRLDFALKSHLTDVNLGTLVFCGDSLYSVSFSIILSPTSIYPYVLDVFCLSS